jgi:hypothetical protein
MDFCLEVKDMFYIYNLTITMSSLCHILSLTNYIKKEAYLSLIMSVYTHTHINIIVILICQLLSSIK